MHFLWQYPYLMPSFKGNLLTQRHQITALETIDPRLPCGENPESLLWAWFGTRTDGQTAEFP